MKLNPIILFIVIILAIFIGLNLPNKQNTTSSNKDIDEYQVALISFEEQQEKFTEFYNSINELIERFQEIDKAVLDLSERNPSKAQTYKTFSDLSNHMEQGQKIPLGRFVPEGYSEEHEEIFNEIIQNLSKTFQYRKFAYNHFVDYIETDSSKSYSDAIDWKESADNALTIAVLNLEFLKLEFGIMD